MSGDIRVMVVDDQELMRDGLVTLLDRQDGIEVVAVAGDGASAIATAIEANPNVVLMDVRMPAMDGVEATKAIVQELPNCRVLMLTTFDDDEYVVGALRAGAVGYVLKNIPTRDLADAIRLAHRGVVQLDRSAAAKVVGQPRTPPDRDAEKRIAELTEREREVLHLIADGASNREIGEQLFISEGTVKTHISRILSQLAMRDRTQLAIFVYRNRLVL